MDDQLGPWMPVCPSFTLSRADETVISTRTWSTWVCRWHILRCCVSELGDTTKPAAGCFLGRGTDGQEREEYLQNSTVKIHLKQ